MMVADVPGISTRAEQADPPQELRPWLLSAQGLTTASSTAGYSPTSTAKHATCPANTPDTSARLCQGGRPGRDCTGQAEGCVRSSQALPGSRTFGSTTKSATGISRHHAAASPQEQRQKAPTNPCSQHQEPQPESLSLQSHREEKQLGCSTEETDPGLCRVQPSS